MSTVLRRPSHAVRSVAATVTATALAAAGLVVLAPAASATDQTVVSTNATWGIKESLRNYVAEQGPVSPRNAITTADCATFDGTVPSTKTPVVNKAGYLWSNGAAVDSFDPAANTGTVRLNGKVTYAYPGHFEAMTLASPTVQLAGTGTGKLLLDVIIDSNALNQHTVARQVEFATLGALPSASSVANADGTTTTTFTGVPTTITAAGATALGDFYPAGTPLDPITVSVTHGTSSTVKAATTTTLGITPTGSSLASVPLTFSSTVTSDAAPGCVEFFQGTTKVGAEPVVAGAASKSIAGLAVGAQALSATFRPAEGAAFAASTSTPVAHSILPPPSTTQLAFSAATVAYGKARTAKVTVRAGVGVAGSVTLTEGSRSYGAKKLVGGTATFALPTTLSVGRHTLTAKYNGSASLQPSSKVAAFSVVKAASKSSGKLSKKTVKVGKKGKVTATVTAAGFTPIGKVEIKKGSKVLKTVTLVRGKATVTLPKLKKGKHKLTVRYRGSATTYASTSSSFTLTVKK